MVPSYFVTLENHFNFMIFTMGECLTFYIPSLIESIGRIIIPGGITFFALFPANYYIYNHNLALSYRQYIPNKFI